MIDAAGWNLRNGVAGTKVLLLSAVASLVLLQGCASELPTPPPVKETRSPVDVRRLTTIPEEMYYLQYVVEQNPEWATNENALRIALGVHRQLNLRTQALAIQFRHQYPSATEEEIAILARDAASREARERQDAITRSILSAPPTSSDSFPMHCFSDKVFGTIYTDCY